MTSTKTTPTVDNEDTATRVGPMHQAFADFLNSQHGGGGITAEQVFLVTSKRKAFRSTDAYRVGVKAAQADAKAQAAQEKEKAKAQRAAQRAAAKAEKEAAAKAENEAAAKAAPVEKPEPKPTAKRAPKAKAATPAKTA